MKEVLLVFDQSINIRYLRRQLHLHLNEIKKIDILPITSEWDLKYKVEKVCCSVNADVTILNSAKLINDQVDKIRDIVSEWSANLGNCKVGDRSLKEWFLTPGQELSTWWFSLLSEKNTLKTDVFFKIAQINAISNLVKLQEYSMCYLSIGDNDLRTAIEKLCTRYSVSVKLLHTTFVGPCSKRELLKRYRKKLGFLGDAINTFLWITTCLLRSLRAKIVMGSLKGRRVSKGSILFVSYFPAIDKEAAVRGVLKNRYAIPLQEKFSQEGRKVIWIWMYCFLDGHHYRDALRFAKKFKDNGEINFFLDEFLSIKVLFNSIYLWQRQIRIFLKLKKLIAADDLYKGLSIPEGVEFIKKLMAESFVGRTGLQGIYYLELYKRVFSVFANVSHCIYYAEMQAWEKALNAAKQVISPEVKTIGFQHTNMAQNYFRYFHHPTEIECRKKPTSLPLPDVLACNGGIPYRLFKKNGYPNLVKVEAVRQLYLADYAENNECIKKEEQILLLAGSYDVTETSLLLSLLYAAFPGTQNFKVWLKGHPAAPIEKICKELKIEYERCRYEVKFSSIDLLLKDATMVLVGYSNVGLEALMFGCAVFIPVFSDRMFISPLGGFDRFYTKIYNPSDLKEVVERTVRGIGIEENNEEIKSLVSDYWCLDKSLQRWEKLFN